MTTYIYLTNKILELTALVIPQDNIIISNYEWTLNNTILSDNINKIIINTNTLNVGENTISLCIKNSCGLWSNKVSKIVTIIQEEEIKVIYTKNKNITLTVIIIKTGTPDNIITTYEWTINKNLQPTNTNQLNINTNILNTGINIISLRTKNSCGLWSNTVSKPIEICPQINKTFDININSTIINKNILIN